VTLSGYAEDEAESAAALEDVAGVAGGGRSGEPYRDQVSHMALPRHSA